uniref:Uncharacterized protein n=1 Tax=Chromera velia CCMP2878 TaxID=1169474 RepID=A0A0G4GCY6_9ALVE|eukprot:Cvel_21352.t1-p1 / transcript=Cvel_21352.t1 / gene=Cvel_21352 / organism=Chromera_velia_CCMP2878 / gene_product=hypothetical protein / transcript_product=hypothetical protein / location=Cvel_scaffold1994:18543-34447(+) / protein_length=1095 / sequence_SO=supercontig / SO=protein_coding / is_pseudo=false
MPSEKSRAPKKVKRSHEVDHSKKTKKVKRSHEVDHSKKKRLPVRRLEHFQMFNEIHSGKLEHLVGFHKCIKQFVTKGIEVTVGGKPFTKPDFMTENRDNEKAVMEMRLMNQPKPVLAGQCEMEVSVDGNEQQFENYKRMLKELEGEGESTDSPSSSSASASSSSSSSPPPVPFPEAVRQREEIFKEVAETVELAMQKRLKTSESSSSSSSPSSSSSAPAAAGAAAAEEVLAAAAAASSKVTKKKEAQQPARQSDRLKGQKDEKEAEAEEKQSAAAPKAKRVSKNWKSDLPKVKITFTHVYFCFNTVLPYESERDIITLALTLAYLKWPVESFEFSPGAQTHFTEAAIGGDEPLPPEQYPDPPLRPAAAAAARQASASASTSSSAGMRRGRGQPDGEVEENEEGDSGEEQEDEEMPLASSGDAEREEGAQQAENAAEEEWEEEQIEYKKGMTLELGMRGSSALLDVLRRYKKQYSNTVENALRSTELKLEDLDANASNRDGNRDLLRVAHLCKQWGTVVQLHKEFLELRKGPMRERETYKDSDWKKLRKAIREIADGSLSGNQKLTEFCEKNRIQIDEEHWQDISWKDIAKSKDLTWEAGKFFGVLLRSPFVDEVEGDVDDDDKDDDEWNGLKGNRLLRSFFGITKSRYGKAYTWADLRGWLNKDPYKKFHGFSSLQPDSIGRVIAGSFDACRYDKEGVQVVEDFLPLPVFYTLKALVYAHFAELQRTVLRTQHFVDDSGGYKSRQASTRGNVTHRRVDVSTQNNLHDGSKLAILAAALEYVLHNEVYPRMRALLAIIQKSPKRQNPLMFATRRVASGYMMSVGPHRDVQESHQDYSEEISFWANTIQIFIPLVDIHQKNSATLFEFSNEYQYYSNAPANSAIVMDNYVRHRGTPHIDNSHRPLIYTSWVDTEKDMESKTNQYNWGFNNLNKKEGTGRGTLRETKGKEKIRRTMFPSRELVRSHFAMVPGGVQAITQATGISEEDLLEGLPSMADPGRAPRDDDPRQQGLKRRREEDATDGEGDGPSSSSSSSAAPPAAAAAAPDANAAARTGSGRILPTFAEIEERAFQDLRRVGVYTRRQERALEMKGKKGPFF